MKYLFWYEWFIIFDLKHIQWIALYILRNVDSLHSKFYFVKHMCIPTLVYVYGLSMFGLVYLLFINMALIAYL